MFFRLAFQFRTKQTVRSVLSHQIKVLLINWLSKPCLTPDIMILTKRTIFLFKLVKQHAIPYSVYQACCNTLGKKVDEAKVVYPKNKFQAYSTNLRSTWKLTNNILG